MGQLTTQRGSVLVVFLLALPVLWGVAQGAFKLAKSTQQALSDQRASDRSAYSMAAVAADTLNQIAINNQTIIAAHLLQGHLVSQMAWTDYAVQLTHKGSWALAWLAPGTSAWIHQKASHAQAFQRKQMPLWTQTLSVVGQVTQSHNQALLMSLPGRLIETNQKAGGPRSQAKINWLQARQFQSVPLQGRVRQAALSNRAWLNARNWSQSFFGLAKLRKRGNTQEVNGQWVAQDQLSFKVRRLFRSKTVTLAQGHSSSRNYGYAGSANLTAFHADELWFEAQAGAHEASARIFPRARARIDQVVLMPDWDAELAVRGLSRDWW